MAPKPWEEGDVIQMSRVGLPSQQSLFSLCLDWLCVPALRAPVHQGIIVCHSFLCGCCLKILFLFYVYECTASVFRQKTASDPIIDGHEPPCGRWELSPGPLAEQSVILTSAPSPQPVMYYFSHLIIEYPSPAQQLAAENAVLSSKST